MGKPDDSEQGNLGTRPEAEPVARENADSLRARAARIRERSVELIDALGADHPLVSEALENARRLEREADAPSQINLR